MAPVNATKNELPEDVASADLGLRHALVYYPSAQICQKNIASRLMAVAAIHPHEYDQSEFARLVGVSPSTVSEAKPHLYEIGWLQRTIREGMYSGGNRYDHYASQRFWDDRQSIEEATTALGGEILEVYQRTCLAFNIDYRGTDIENQNTDLRTRAEWVGGIAILGDVCDPAQYGTWLSGTEGWDVLVRTSIPHEQK